MVIPKGWRKMGLSEKIEADDLWYSSVYHGKNPTLNDFGIPYGWVGCAVSQIVAANKEVDIIFIRMDGTRIIPTNPSRTIPAPLP